MQLKYLAWLCDDMKGHVDSEYYVDSPILNGDN